MTRHSLWFCIQHVATNNLKLHECHYHSGTLQTANTCNLILINRCSLNHTKDKIKTENKVRTITSALLVFIHHWYIIVWWKNWKNYPYYSLWLSTRTRILAWKTRKGAGESVTARGGSCNVHVPSPAIICLHTYLYLLGLTWRPNVRSKTEAC